MAVFLRRLVCSVVRGWCAVSHFVLEKSRLVGRKERGRGVAGGAGVGGRGGHCPQRRHRNGDGLLT